MSQSSALYYKTWYKLKLWFVIRWPSKKTIVNRFVHRRSHCRSRVVECVEFLCVLSVARACVGAPLLLQKKRLVPRSKCAKLTHAAHFNCDRPTVCIGRVTVFTIAFETQTHIWHRFPPVSYERAHCKREIASWICSQHHHHGRYSSTHQCEAGNGRFVTAQCLWRWQDAVCGGQSSRMDTVPAMYAVRPNAGQCTVDSVVEFAVVSIGCHVFGGAATQEERLRTDGFGKLFE